MALRCAAGGKCTMAVRKLLTVAACPHRSSAVLGKMKWFLDWLPSDSDFYGLRSVAVPCARSFEKAWPARQGGLIPHTRQLFGNQRPHANAEFVICSFKLRDCVFDDAGCPPTIPSTTRASIHRSSLSFGHMHARLHRLRLETTCDLIPPACSPRFVRKGAESRILYRSGRSARPVLPVPTMRLPFAGASIGVFQPARILRDQRIRWHNACC
jgi:hypothetical protein